MNHYRPYAVPGKRSRLIASKQYTVNTMQRVPCSINQTTIKTITGVRRMQSIQLLLIASVNRLWHRLNSITADGFLRRFPISANQISPI